MLKLRLDQKGDHRDPKTRPPKASTILQLLTTIIIIVIVILLIFTSADSPPESLLRYCTVWNTNARNCQDAQAVLRVLLTHVPPEELMQYQGARTHLEGLIPYTGERHLSKDSLRVERENQA